MYLTYEPLLQASQDPNKLAKFEVLIVMLFYEYKGSLNPALIDQEVGLFYQ